MCFSDSGVTIPFAVSKDSLLYFVTAGGGQFSGENKLLGGVQNDPGIIKSAGNVPEEKDIKEDSSQSFNMPYTNNEYEEGVYDMNTDDTNDTSVHTSAGTVEETSGGIRIIVIWVLLLFGVIITALIPLIFSRTKDRKHSDI